MRFPGRLHSYYRSLTSNSSYSIHLFTTHTPCFDSRGVPAHLSLICAVRVASRIHTPYVETYGTTKSTTPLGSALTCLRALFAGVCLA